MKKETFREFTLITNEGRYFTYIVAKDKDQAKAIVDSYLGTYERVVKINYEPISGREFLAPSQTLPELKFSERIRKELKEGQIKLVSAYSEDLYKGYAEYENNGEYIGVNFEYDFTYIRSGYDRIPEFSIEVTTIYDYEGDEITNIAYDVARVLANQIAEDINDDNDLDRWLSWGVDEDELDFYDDTPAYPITL